MSYDVSVKTGAYWQLFSKTQKSWRKNDQLGVDFRIKRGLIFHFRLKKRKSEMNFFDFFDPVSKIISISQSANRFINYLKILNWIS